MNTAKEIVTSEAVEHHHDAEIPTAETVIYTDDQRAAVVAKFRELADRLERRELNGASVQWNENPDQPAMVYVECFPVVRCTTPEDIKKYGEHKRTTRLVRATFEPAQRPRLV